MPPAVVPAGTGVGVGTIVGSWTGTEGSAFADSGTLTLLGSVPLGSGTLLFGSATLSTFSFASAAAEPVFATDSIRVFAADVAVPACVEAVESGVTTTGPAAVDFNG